MLQLSENTARPANVIYWWKWRQKAGSWFQIYSKRGCTEIFIGFDSLLFIGWKVRNYGCKVWWNFVLLPSSAFIFHHVLFKTCDNLLKNQSKSEFRYNENGYLVISPSRDEMRCHAVLRGKLLMPVILYSPHMIQINWWRETIHCQRLTQILSASVSESRKIQYI